MQMINAYRVRGHLIADLDPLGAEPSYHAELDPETYGLTIWDLDREFLTGSLGEAIGEGAPKSIATLREILETLRQTYCGKIGAEYMNIQVPEQKRWLQQRMEPEANNWKLEREVRMRILRSLIAGEEFEHFLHSRFVGQKRFALEGGETALAIMEELLERAAFQNVHEIVIGMAHRGRLNLLVNTAGKDVKLPSNSQVDLTRTITVEFDANSHGPWKFKPQLASLQVHPGQLATVMYEFQNVQDRRMAAQAIPSYAPARPRRISTSSSASASSSTRWSRARRGSGRWPS